MNTYLMRRALAGVCLMMALLVGLLAASGQAAAAPGAQTGTAGGPPDVKPQVKAPPMSDQTIPGVPLRAVARDSGTVGIFYNAAGQYYADYAEGIYLWVNGQVWGPAGVPLGPTVHEYSPMSNSLIGTGTSLTPWRTMTRVGVGGTGLQLVRSVQYVNGSLWTRHDYELANNSSLFYNISLFHAADLQTGGSSKGYGYYFSVNGGIGSYDSGHAFYQLFIPVTPGSRYKEDIWSSIWGSIGNVSGPGPGFNNSYRNDLIDNGAGLQWTFTIVPGQRVAVTDFHSFSTSPTCTQTFTDVFASDYYFDAVMYLSCQQAISGYSDGSFRPGNNTTRGQLSKIITLAEGWTIDTTGGPHFTDVPTTNAFYQYVETAYNRGVIGGYADGTFRPNADITRGQLCKIITLAEVWPINTSGGPHFIDVPTNHAFYQYIETAYNHGVISGYSDSTFRPSNSATRGQISKIVYSALVLP
jgi:hypothetical protein